MSATYLCDRCSNPCTPPSIRGSGISESVRLADWCGDGTIDPPRQEPLLVTITVQQEAADYDSPDLCLACRYEVVGLVLNNLKTLMEAKP